MEVWGKSKQNGKIVTLAEHTLDVLKAFECLKKNISSEKIQKLIEIVIKYHDLGKVLPYFQIKTLKNTEYQPFDVFANIPHSILSTLLVKFDELEQSVKSVVRKAGEKEDYVQFVLSAIAYHHWRESFYDIVEGNSSVFENLNELVNDKIKWKIIENNIEKVCKNVCKNVRIDLKKTGLNSNWLNGLVNGIRFADYVTPPYQLYRMPDRIEIDSDKLKDRVLISGFTMLADHFASLVETEPDAKSKEDRFKNIDVAPLKYNAIKKEISTQLKNKIGNKYDETKIWQFEKVIDYQRKNTILLAPTGMGKTEFAYLWSAGRKFFYTLPLRAAVNQIYDRTKTIFGEDLSGILHSDADIYIYGDGGDEESMRIYDFSRQLSMAANISTGDQFFPYALRPPGYEKVFAKFSYSNLIIDEIQAYDPKAAAIAVKFMEHVVQMGGKFLLMTATLPVFIENELNERISDFETLNLFDDNNLVTDFAKHKVNVIIDNYTDGKLSYREEIIEQIINKAKEKEGQRILVVLNTIAQAQKVYQDIKSRTDSNIEVKLFHSRYSFEHRQKIEDELQEFIGNKETSRNDIRPKILVATQVVEASLDLDADYLFTELAPWDSLIQRMGRVLRELRPETENKGALVKRRYGLENLPENVFLMIYDGNDKKGRKVFESGRGFVYHKELLNATLKLLEVKEITINDKDLKKLAKGELPLTFDNLKKKFKKGRLKLSEKNKSELVKKLYEVIGNEGKYLRDFYDMLQVLDAGYMSDRKSEAQKIFREISDVSIIPENLKDDFFKAVYNFDFTAPMPFTRFKKDVISRFTVNIQRYKVEEYLIEINLAARQIELDDEFTNCENAKKNIRRLNKWLWGIYFADVEYDEMEGLKGINDNKLGFEIF